MALQKFKIALLQLSVTANKAQNLEVAVKHIKEAATNGAKLICLSECFAFPYGAQFFRDYAETIPGETSRALSDAAKANQVFLVGGSMSETDNQGKLYNTCLVYGPDGNLLAKHRKVHLFDIDIPGKMTFKESDSFTPGDNFSTFETPFCRVGLGICYDIRFAPMAQIYAKQGCKLVLYPGAFNMVTGPLHWELLCRARSIDNELYTATISPARDCNAKYVAYGHSMLCDPMGRVVASAQEKPEIVYADIDLDLVEETRKQIPIHGQKRTDLYDVVDKTKAGDVA